MGEEQNYNTENIDNILGMTLPGMEGITTILGLPEEQFQTISAILLDEYQKQLNIPENRIKLLQIVQIPGISKEELISSYEKAAQAFLLMPEEDLSTTKKDFFIRILKMLQNLIEEDFGESRDIVNIPIELCHKDAKIPYYANAGDAGLDIFALEDYTIKPGETKLIPTGIKVAIPYGYELQVRPKSGRSLKTKLRVANTPGTIDSGYRQEIGVIIENIESPIQDITYTFDNNGKPIIESILHGKPYYINKGEKFAQLILTKVSTTNFFEVSNIGEIEGDRGGGFGSSGLR